MIKINFLLMITLLITSCHHGDQDEVRNEIFQAEKAFEKMAAEKGVAEAFYYFADENAVIKRQNDTLIKGKADIKAYYSQNYNEDVTVKWSPDYIDVSDCGTLGYTYGKYVWKIKNKQGAMSEYKGIFHTVWKKQKDGTWKYVWD
jgi:ketosteroid isomerase-like protein